MLVDVHAPDGRRNGHCWKHGVHATYFPMLSEPADPRDACRRSCRSWLRSITSRENVQPLVDWILEALGDYPETFEVILVDDGSRDDTWARIAQAAAVHPGVHGLRLGRNVGQTAAMMAGFDHARGRVVVSLDGDLQNDPRDIPMLVAKLDEGYDLVCGWRQRGRTS